jgi:CHAT domain-containing protein
LPPKDRHALDTPEPDVNYTALRLAQAATPDASGPLVITLRHAGDANELTGADAELAEVLARFPDAPRLVGPDATKKNVLDGLDRHPWVHFACHAVGDIEAPTGDRLLLHDGPVTLEDIAERVRRQSAGSGLALLLACETARCALAVADEGIHIASGFRLAGYQNVIAFLWPVSDPVAERTVVSCTTLPADRRRSFRPTPLPLCTRQYVV